MLGRAGPVSLGSCQCWGVAILMGQEVQEGRQLQRDAGSGSDVCWAPKCWRCSFSEGTGKRSPCFASRQQEG